MHKKLYRLGSSIFAKLLAISVGMGLIISTAVGIFFFIVVHPLLKNVPPEQQTEVQSLHDRMLVVLIILLVLVVFAGHAMLRRVLAPIRWLQQGVDALRQGDLQVVVPRRTDDELGALTLAFNQMVSRVSEMLRARDQLLLDVSHELRSPLTRMKVALALCENDEHTQRLRANIDEMESMVAELLERERLRQGHGLQLEQYDLMEIVRDAIATFQDYAPGVHLEQSPQSLLLRLDADKVRTVLGNLLENAAKYALPESAATRVCVTQDTESVQLRVTDDGPGIPTSDLGNLFEPFFRVDRSRSKRTGGYGLGLSLCKRIMEAHGGSIAALNNESRGSTFILKFSSSLESAHGASAHHNRTGLD